MGVVILLLIFGLIAFVSVVFVIGSKLKKEEEYVNEMFRDVRKQVKRRYNILAEIVREAKKEKSLKNESFYVMMIPHNGDELPRVNRIIASLEKMEECLDRIQKSHPEIMELKSFQKWEREKNRKGTSFHEILKAYNETVIDLNNGTSRGIYAFAASLFKIQVPFAQFEDAKMQIDRDDVIDNSRMYK